MSDSSNDDSLYPIAVLIDELRNEDVQVSHSLFKQFPLLNYNVFWEITIKLPMRFRHENLPTFGLHPNIAPFSFAAAPQLDQEVVNHRVGTRCRKNSIRAHSFPDGHNLWWRRGSSCSRGTVGQFHPARGWIPVRSLSSAAAGVLGYRWRNYCSRQSKKIVAKVRRYVTGLNVYVE